METPLIAIDVAFLLPDDAQAHALAVNATLWAQSQMGFRFDETHLPHITLLQQFVRRANLPDVFAAVDAVLEEFSPLTLTISHVETRGETAQFVIAPHAELQRLHERLLEALAPFDEGDGPAEAFANGDEPPRPRDLEWVRNYRAQASGSHYFPHITLGKGIVTEPIAPFAFTADHIAVCQLGRFCTCRVILREWRLRAR
ncbi:MAG: 2'-5' RNA ligase family protein [Blastocatellia bacterium]|nr:2'-5' RNA ligase family protein [Blastocatellia bacterium]MCS7156670.1 2'-5' RNA ligase family protein [Blastocatellia bacterium]MCX7751588.1 2'-5' RNA ligase family protein [Blastocatellia bacterium]MDW8168688.1 2'-5' RNA ligase family protein [Acidobacteriota bacterium]MDW8255851.1 2'-5' RNA ligase family protein [Acidobacteriota bacterium]